jgi:hypothetical protein
MNQVRSALGPIDYMPYDFLGGSVPRLCQMIFLDLV